MRQIMLRPDLRTAGGEVSDILLDGRYVGTLTIVYREGDRAAGSAQLDEGVLPKSDKKEVIAFLQQYVQMFSNAVLAEHCDVLITYSGYDRIVSFKDGLETDLANGYSSFTDEFPTDEQDFDADDDEDDDEELEYEWQSSDEDVSFELVVIEEDEESAEYHVYDDNDSRVAKIYLGIEEGQVSGDVNWKYEPDEDAVSFITELIIRDFDDKQMHGFQLRHLHKGTVIQTAEMTPDDADSDEDEDAFSWQAADDLFEVVLVRDDGDALTYEIYDPEEDGNHPIGTATVDIHQRRLSGYIDFRDLIQVENAAEIAAILMRELDKERDYDGLNLSLMHRNEHLDDIVIDNEPVDV
ncbi:hypothetical protein [Paenibacillus methanolicus]|uniref:Uncharacterized protein n=1 Tax=Paenibacillus methanolicus TaxID=582686 RepID=A0A5S5CKJ3_9BACL|nr:hypothetical protein [Paenibacillus methanolicus]TYP79493.1 hypothetical protein BCM02_101611 [Paenibacillus methanolicus]